MAAYEKGRPFQIVFYDTFQAGFAGVVDEANSNTQVLELLQKIRLLTELPGNPSVLIAAHPTKNAGEDSLVPYGGGSAKNECDGNLTLWRTNSNIIKLHHHDKIRGPTFEPLSY